MTWALWAFLGAVLAGQLVTTVGRAVARPDAYSYVAMAESARAGSGFVVKGETRRWPPGYPAILASLMSAGAGTEFSYQLVNLSAVLAGLAILLSRLAKRGLPRNWQLVVALLVLLSRPVLLTVNFVLSDCVFFFGLMATIELLELAHDATARRRATLLVAALLALVLASLVRAAGLVLLPALLVTVAKPWAGTFTSRRGLLAVCAAALAGVLLMVWVDVGVLKSGYVVQARENVVKAAGRSGVAGELLERSFWRLSFVGRHVVNRELKYRGPARALFPLAGAAGLALLAAVVARGRRLSRPLELFLISYLLVLFVYPAFTDRLWLPVVPLALGLLALWASARRDAVTRAIVALFVVAYCGLGARLLEHSIDRATRSNLPLAERLLTPAPAHP